MNLSIGRRFRAMAAALVWFGLAGAGFGEDPAGPVALLGVVSQDAVGTGNHPVVAERPAGDDAAAAPGAASLDTPWQRLPESVRADLFGAIRRQLDQPARREEGLAGKEPVAAANTTAKAYRRWRDLGAVDPAWKSDETWPRFFFDRELDGEGRRILLSVYAKLKAEHIWQKINTFDRFDPSSPWPGFWAVPWDPEDFRRQLEALGYGADQVQTRGTRWAVRSSRTGMQFHVIGPEAHKDPRFVEIHLDFASPGVMTVEATLGSVVTAPVREVCYGVGAAWHWVKDVKHWGRDDYGERNDRMADRVKAAVHAQGIDVPDVDQGTYGAVVLSDLLKWDTGRSSEFGHVWLAPRRLHAGWWTGSGGSRSFTKVQQLGSTANPRFVLSYENGWVEITIEPGGGLRGRWYTGSGVDERNVPTHTEIHGSLVLGHVDGAPR
ncbi:MAG: hypothetical protein HY815_29795 [Candidatus Riflebacteria bacterium]|nr:hypothetical protein [Candidatus Riflebacteria bacterium]